MNRSYQYILLRRGLGFWLGTRLILLGVTAYLRQGQTAAALGGSIALPPIGIFVYAAALAALVLFDAAVVGEDVLVANFGVSRLQCWLVVAGLVCVMETGILVLA